MCYFDLQKEDTRPDSELTTCHSTFTQRQLINVIYLKYAFLFVFKDPDAPRLDFRGHVWAKAKLARQSERPTRLLFLLIYTNIPDCLRVQVKPVVDSVKPGRVGAETVRSTYPSGQSLKPVSSRVESSHVEKPYKISLGARGQRGTAELRCYLLQCLYLSLSLTLFFFS